MYLIYVGPLFLAASVVVVDDSGGSKEAQKIKSMREAILNHVFGPEHNSAAVGKAYKALFTHLGLQGLRKVTDDQDTSIALQSAWETHKKAVKRNFPVRGRTDWVFDKESMDEFLAFFAKRTKAEPPAWWQRALRKGDVFPGEHHAFVDIDDEPTTRPKVEVEKDDAIITAGKQSIRIAKKAYENVLSAVPAIATARVALWGTDESFFAMPTSLAYPFQVVGVDLKKGKRPWTASVWAARRGPYSGPSGRHPVEILRHGDTVIVYGCELPGTYAEGFDAKTGKCQFRFCTCYWFNFSEAWGLK